MIKAIKIRITPIMTDNSGISLKKLLITKDIINLSLKPVKIIL